MNFALLDPTTYAQQLASKQQHLAESFAEFTPPALEVFASEPEHYRMRAEFRVWHEGDDLYYYMFDNVEQKKVRTDQFLPAGRLINEMMLALMDKLRPNDSLRRKLFQVDFLSTLSGEILVSLLYHRQLDEAWIDAAKQLKAELSAQFKVDIIGRARKQKIVLDREFVVETLTVNGQALHYKQIENSFTQPNAKVSVKMLEWAIDSTKSQSGDLVELYCGNGNFSIALAQNFERVLATELAKPSVDAAQYNIEANGVKNLEIYRMSAEDFSAAMQGQKFTRLKDVDLGSYQFNTIFVDPPRAGLDPATITLVQQYPSILYISCNPETLHDNLKTLSTTHKITRFAMFDQFPYTHHIECGVLLERR